MTRVRSRRQSGLVVGLVVLVILLLVIVTNNPIVNFYIRLLNLNGFNPPVADAEEILTGFFQGLLVLPDFIVSLFHPRADVFLNVARDLYVVSFVIGFIVFIVGVALPFLRRRF